MAEPVWLDHAALMAAHDEVVRLTGGAPGLRDEGLLLSALARPRNAYDHEGTDDIPLLGDLRRRHSQEPPLR